jgi:hypothetical protein
MPRICTILARALIAAVLSDGGRLAGDLANRTAEKGGDDTHSKCLSGGDHVKESLALIL